MLVGAGDEVTEDVEQHGESDRLLRLEVLLTVVPLDPSNEALHERRLTGGKGEVHVSVHRPDVCDVLLDCPGLHPAGEVGEPGHDGDLRGGENGAVRIVETVEFDKLDVTGLAGVVASACTGSEPMPKVECDGFGPEYVVFIPPSRMTL